MHASIRNIIILLALLIFSSTIALGQVTNVLKINGGDSYVLNKNTGVKIPYNEFLNSEQINGHELEFFIVVENTGNAIPTSYVLELRTDLLSPEWKFNNKIYNYASVIVWNADEHNIPRHEIQLNGIVPSPIKGGFKEPNFDQSIDLTGIGKQTVSLDLTVGTTEDEKTLKEVKQRVASIQFFATSTTLMDSKKTTESNLEYAKEIIGKETDLEKNIRSLSESGHPGWALKLSEGYKTLVGEMTPPPAPPILLYVVVALILGLLIGSGAGFMFGKSGGIKKGDLESASSDLINVSSKLDESSKTINSMSNKLARKEDSEQRELARELIGVRATLNEISNRLRSIYDRLQNI
ncbi:MAG: hypothetical protein ACE5J3_13840 [Methanosarcinales archaeon]